MTSALIIDDNPMNLDSLAALLKKEGVQQVGITTFKDLEKALAQLERVDVVFLDLEFPNDSGFQILTKLKVHERLRDVPIIAYTVHVSERAEARQAGFDGFLGKPLMVDRFSEQLKRILRGESVWEVP